MNDMTFASEMGFSSLGTTAASIMTDCEKFGMTYGCQSDCPQLIRGKYEIYSNVEEFEQCEK